MRIPYSFTPSIAARFFAAVALFAGTALAQPDAALGRLPDLESVAISPSGKRIGFIRTDGDLRTVVVFVRGATTHEFGLRVSEDKIRDLEWIDDDHLLVITSTHSTAWGILGSAAEWWQGSIVDLPKRKIEPLSLRAEGLETMNVIGGETFVREVAGRAQLLVVGLYALGGEMQPALFRVDPKSGRTTVVDKAETHCEWLVADDGTVAGTITYNQSNHRWTLRMHQNGHGSVAMAGEALVDRPDFKGLTPDGQDAIVSLPTDTGRAWARFRLADGKANGTFEGTERLRSLHEGRLSSRVTGGRTFDGKRLVYFDPKRQADWSAIVRAHADATVTPESQTDDGRLVIVLVDDPDEGYYYELFDLDARRGVKLGDVYEGLGTHARAKEITYPARDDRAITAILTLPRGKDPKQLPLVVMPHGGPASRSTTDYDWFREALARAGYAVLEPNFRGSNSSWELQSAGFGEWGRKMQTDLTDGVHHLVKEGIADPARVCIVGASYGGYAALAGVTLDADTYRCAVSIAGLSDLRRMLKWEDAQMGRRNTDVQNYWDRYMGVTGPQDHLLDTISPIAHIDAIKAPVLLIHGQDDTVVAYEQSTVMRDAMQKAHKPVTFVTLKREDHWLSRSATRQQTLAETLRFLVQNNPP